MRVAIRRVTRSSGLAANRSPSVEGDEKTTSTGYRQPSDEYSRPASPYDSWWAGPCHLIPRHGLPRRCIAPRLNVRSPVFAPLPFEHVDHLVGAQRLIVGDPGGASERAARPALHPDDLEPVLEVAQERCSGFECHRTRAVEDHLAGLTQEAGDMLAEPVPVRDAIPLRGGRPIRGVEVDQVERFPIKPREYVLRDAGPELGGEEGRSLGAVRLPDEMAAAPKDVRLVAEVPTTPRMEVERNVRRPGLGEAVHRRLGRAKRKRRCHRRRRLGRCTGHVPLDPRPRRARSPRVSTRPGGPLGRH